MEQEEIGPKMNESALFNAKVGDTMKEVHLDDLIK